MPSSTPVSQRHLDRNILRHGIAARRQRLAEIETSMVEACERAAMSGGCRNVRIDDCKTWDKAAWQRYLEAAARLEPDYLPQIAQTAPGHREIRAAAHYANSSRARCMTDPDHAEEYWIRQITDRTIMRGGSMTRFQ
jgi:hypothetical protein